MDDPYATLEVGRDAGADEIRRSFKRLALKLHPDKSASADDEAFKKVNEAYAVLNDPDRKRAYDMFGTTTPQQQQQQQHAHHFVFNMFQQHQQQQQQHPQHRDAVDIVLTPREVYLGCTKHIEYTVLVACPKCDGTSAASPSDVVTCMVCGGTGAMPLPGMPAIFGLPPCPACGGQGRSFRSAKRCDGCANGCVPKRMFIEVAIPGGARDGLLQTRSGGGGYDLRTRTTTDLDVRVRRTLPSNCTLSGENDVLMTVPLDLTDVLCGFDKTVDVFDGAESVRVSADAYVWPGRSVVFPDKGLLCPGTTEGRGKLTVVFEVKYPKDQEDAAATLVTAVFKIRSGHP